MGCKWNCEDKELHNNALKLLAIKVSIKEFCPENNTHVKIMCDNSTAITYIKEMGSMQSVMCDKIAREI